MAFQIGLVVNIVTCFLCVILGALCFLAPKKPGPHTEIGEAFHVSCLGWALTSVYIALVHWVDVGWLMIYAMTCYGINLCGYVSAKLRFEHWLKIHLICQSSSYIGILSVFIFMNNKTGIWWLCLLPGVTGIPIIGYLYTRVLPSKIQNYANPQDNSE